MVHKEKQTASGGQATDLQDLLKKLIPFGLDECLRDIADELRNWLHCETVSILLWNEARQDLRTEYPSGLPSKLKRPETYKLDEGITGKYIFREERCIRALIDFGNLSVHDAESGEVIQDATIQWANMKIFKANSTHGDFKSLLGAPLFIKKQKIGVVKLINRMDDQTNLLASGGFDEDDLSRLQDFLKVIEDVIETKRNEKQIASLLEIGQKNASLLFDFNEIVKEVARHCAEALNYNLCVIRLREKDQFRVVQGPDKRRGAEQIPQAPYKVALDEKTPIKWKAGAAALKNLDESLTYPAPEIEEVFADCGVQAFLLVPIIYQGEAIGTIECYTTLPHEFSPQEVNLIDAYIVFLVIARMNDKQQKLLSGLIEVSRTETTWGLSRDEESQLIEEMLDRIVDSLGQGRVSLAILFSEKSLRRTGLNINLQFEARKYDLRHLVTKDEYGRLINEFSRHSDCWDRARDYKIAGDQEAVSVHAVPIPLTPNGNSLGVILVPVRGGGRMDAFSKSVIDLSAKHIGVALGYIDRLRKIERLPQIINTISKKDKFEDVSDLILDETLNLFGFDYATISRVDYAKGRVKTEKGKSLKEALVNPERWKPFSDYNLDTDDDILVYIVKKKRSILIKGLESSRDWKLNEEIVRQFHHENLIRIFVPFTFHKTPPDNNKGEGLVLGVIEAGYHKSTQWDISKHHREVFEIFINQCAESLQRVNLLEQRQAIEEIVQRLNSQEGTRDVLQRLLQETVKLVRADSGTIMFLTHRDENLHLWKLPLTHGLNKEQFKKMKASVPIRSTGKQVGIVARVAAQNESYWSNDVAKDEFYIKEFDEVKSELAVPLSYHGRPVGVLDIYSYKPNWFDKTKADLVEAIAEQAMLLFQKVRISQSLTVLVNPFSPFSSIEDIYKKVIEITEAFLETDAVSVWEKTIKVEDFDFKLAQASEGLQALYDQEKISEVPLPPSYFSSRAVETRKIVEVSEKWLGNDRPRNSEFARKNGLRSMTSVPILTGQEVYAVIEVFSHRDAELFPEEKSFLELLASKAAIAIQNANLSDSFNAITVALAEGEIDDILKTITESACKVLQADPVILYRYEPEQKQFLRRHPIFSGDLFHPEIKTLAGVREGDFVHLILRQGTTYVENEKEYFDLQSNIERDIKNRHFEKDFWTREKIQAMAALRLGDASGILGVMFINYRTARKFDRATKELVSGFAAMAASAIAKGNLVEQNRRFWESQRHNAQALMANNMVLGIAHDSGNLLTEILIKTLKFEQNFRKAPDGEVREVSQSFLKEVKLPLKALTAEFKRLEEYRQFEKFRMEPWSVEELIDETLQLFNNRFEGKIEVTKHYLPTPAVFCDKPAIKQVLFNLFLNSCEAMKRKGSLDIYTEVTGNARQVRISIKDSGGGIPKDVQPRVFELFFTTKRKKGGTGVGLAVSRYIIQSHGGSIEFESTQAGTTFSIFLPLRRRDKDV